MITAFLLHQKQYKCALHSKIDGIFASYKGAWRHAVSVAAMISEDGNEYEMPYY